MTRSVRSGHPDTGRSGRRRPESGRPASRPRRAPLRAAALAALPVLLAATGCSVTFGDGGGQGSGVFGKPLSQQFAAAVEATRAAGSLRFTATVEYAGLTATARYVTEGRADFEDRTAEATLTRDVPEGFADAADLDEGAAAYPQRYAVAGAEVRARTADGGWLGYSPAARKALDPRGAAPVTAHAPGAVLPFGGTAAELLAAAKPHATPVSRPDGVREYRTTVPIGEAQKLLPQKLAFTTTAPGVMTEPVPLIVRLDSRGRLVGAEADLALLLERIQHGPGADHLKGVTRLTATFLASGFGTASDLAPAPAADARRATAVAFGLARGTCAVPAAGLADATRVRPTPCGSRHTMRFFAAAGTKHAGRTTPVQYVQRTCDGPFRDLPQEWRTGTEPEYKNIFSVHGSSFSYRFDATGKAIGPPPELALDVACFLATKA
ncbi:hypothetical protein [Streptomyces sp. NPDC089919]|uniref:hypothetical protein n=1 Tax=Streptomyces sp. NPDC089919 TaxID=3155188 RepID=UPI00342F260C